MVRSGRESPGSAGDIRCQSFPRGRSEGTQPRAELGTLGRAGPPACGGAASAWCEPRMLTNRCLFPWDERQRASSPLPPATQRAPRAAHATVLLRRSRPDPSRCKVALPTASETLRAPRHATHFREDAAAGGRRAARGRGGRPVRLVRRAVGNEQLPLSRGKPGLGLTGMESSREKCIPGGRPR